MFGETKGEEVAIGDISKSDVPSLFLRRNLKMKMTARSDMIMTPMMTIMMMMVGETAKKRYLLIN